MTLDGDTVHDIAHVQCNGDEARACKLVEDIVAAPITGDKLARRYFQFIAWNDAGCPASTIRRAVEADLRRGK